MRSVWTWVLGGLLGLGGCGGHVKDREREQPATAGAPASSNGGTAGVAAAGAAAAGLAGAGAAAGAELVGCPNAEWNEACPSWWRAELDFTGGTAEPADIWVEALQLPTFEADVLAPQEPVPPTDPADWDRSEMPAGACVFRLHGVTHGCLSSSMSFQGGACGSDGPHVVPLSFYELAECGKGVAPGCPSSDPWDFSGQYWYAVPSRVRADETTIVVCAALCKPWLGTQACLVAGGD